MSILTYVDYKKWVNDRIQSMPSRGRGQLTAIAKYLSTSTSIVTLVFKGERDLTPEQAVLLGEFFGLTKFEHQYFILLVNYSRAGTHRYKQILKEEIEDFQKRAEEIKSHVAQNTKLTEETKSILYSNWYYLAIWSLTAISGFDSIDVIAERLNLSRSKANVALQFLVKVGLVTEKNGKLSVGPTLIHLESSSPQVSRHHQNWRLRAFPKHESPTSEELFYTAPVTLAAEDVKKIKEKTLKFISDCVNDIKESPSEKLFCLCLDWFEV